MARTFVLPGVYENAGDEGPLSQIDLPHWRLHKRIVQNGAGLQRKLKKKLVICNGRNTKTY